MLDLCDRGRRQLTLEGRFLLKPNPSSSIDLLLLRIQRNLQERACQVQVKQPFGTCLVLFNELIDDLEPFSQWSRETFLFFPIGTQATFQVPRFKQNGLRPIPDLRVDLVGRETGRLNTNFR